MKTLLLSQHALTDDTWIIRASQRLDNNNAEEMVNALQQAHANGFHTVRINCAQLTFLSSAGVGSLLAYVDEFREKGGDLVLYSVSESIIHVLTVLDLADYFTIETGSVQAEAHDTMNAERI